MGQKTALSVKRFSWINLYQLLVVVLAAIVLAVFAVRGAVPDLLSHYAPKPFDMVEAVREYPLVPLMFTAPGDVDLENRSLEEAWADYKKRSRSNSRYSPDALSDAYYHYKLSQRGRYRFTIEPEEVWESGVAYESILYVNGAEMERAPSNRYVLVAYQGALILTNVRYHQENFERLQGAFVPLNVDVFYDIEDLYQMDFELENVFPFAFDTTADFTSQRLGSSGWAVACTVLAVFLSAKWVRMASDKNKRPIYKQLNLLGGDEGEVDAQLQEAKKQNKQYVLHSWIITPSMFTTHLTRNLDGFTSSQRQ